MRNYAIEIKKNANIREIMNDAGANINAYVECEDENTFEIELMSAKQAEAVKADKRVVYMSEL